MGEGLFHAYSAKEYLWDHYCQKPATGVWRALYLHGPGAMNNSSYEKSDLSQLLILKFLYTHILLIFVCVYIYMREPVIDVKEHLTIS